MDPKSDEFEKAREKALSYILFKKRTGFEVRRKLERSGFEEAEINKVINHYLKLKYIDDEAFTEKFIDEWKRLKCESVNKLRLTLKKKGISNDLISKYIECTGNTVSGEFDRIKLCFIKKYGELGEFNKREFDDIKFKRKFYYYFGSRGFDIETIRRLVELIGVADQL